MKKILNVTVALLITVVLCLFTGCFSPTGVPGNNVLGKVSSPVFSVKEGVVGFRTTIFLFCETEGADIYYTLDGTVPTVTSTKYTTPITIITNVMIKAIAIKSGMNESEVSEAIYTIDFIPPADVTDLTATCTASQTVKISWINPKNDDFAKVVIAYDTGKNITILKTADINNEITINELTNGTEYKFTIKAYDNAGNASSGVSVNITPVVPRGGFIGTPTQIQGEIVKENWINTISGNLIIDDGTGTDTKVEIEKTSEVVVVPVGTVAEIAIPDDSSWSTYYSGLELQPKGVFLSGRKVKIDSFVMSQYQVTQKFYEKVMGTKPSYFSSSQDGIEIQENRPVESITWYQACAFCNELTKKTFGDSTDQCVYYNEEGNIYSIIDASSEKNVVIADKSYDTTTHKWTKKGYRLPTEAEWEFAARGGNPVAKDNNEKLIWNFGYAGVQTSTIFGSAIDASLNDYAWYIDNGSGMTHEVGKKSPNTLGLYDMSGNVWEWCYDWYSSDAKNNDEDYKDTSDNVLNPLGSADGVNRVMRGGFFGTLSWFCVVSYRGNETPNFCEPMSGFRVCRSTN